MTAHTSHRPNRLIHERSPYLQQHAYNPVDWHPWGAEAFEQAKREDKPVFLSIGYSTCYWCHVMEEESFENPAIAQLINDSCVPVKVDREERPDIDSVYMIAVQAMSGQGGWPMTVFLTPEGKPFWGGTYVPPEDRDGRPGMPRLVQAIAEAWKTNRPQLLASSESVANALQAQAPPAAAQPVTVELLSAAVAQLTTQFDPTFAGFGDAPKFPRSHTLSMLLRVWRRQPDAHVLQMVEATLQAMAAGGIHDHLGGGFHRYSTDAQWLVPHFEKMLYDQALLARTYVEAYQATGKAEYAEAARDIFDYVLRDLRDPAGGFYSAEDAGGVGREGEYYVWSLEEIQRTLGQLAADRFARVYGVTAEGNFAPPHHGDGAAGPPKNVLHRARSVEVAASELGVTPAALQENLAADRAKLLAARGQRPRPHRDEKVLTDWNGLMIGALAYGGRALDEPRYIRAAEQAAAFVEQQLQRDGRLLHRWRERQADIPAFLDDYAFLSDGLVDLYEATFDPRWLAQAAALTESMVQLFWDEPAGGFWFSGAQNETLIARTKELYDGALPSGNSVAATVLVRLGRLTQRRAWLDRAERLFGAFSAALQQMPSAFPQCLIAIDGWLGPSQEIVIAGDPAAAGTREMIRLVHRRFLPRAGLALHPTGPAAARIESLIPFLASQPPIDGRPTAYVCRDYVCGLPATDVAALGQRLDQSAR